MNAIKIAIGILHHGKGVIMVIIIATKQANVFILNALSGLSPKTVGLIQKIVLSIVNINHHGLMQ